MRRNLWLGKPIEDLLRALGYPTSCLRMLIWAALTEMGEAPLPPHLQELAPLVGAATKNRRLRPELVQKLPQVVDAYLAAQGAPVPRRGRTYAVLLALSPMVRVKLILEGRKACTSVAVAEEPEKPMVSDAPPVMGTVSSPDSSTSAPRAEGREPEGGTLAPPAPGGDA